MLKAIKSFLQLLLFRIFYIINLFYLLVVPSVIRPSSITSGTSYDLISYNIILK